MAKLYIQGKSANSPMNKGSAKGPAPKIAPIQGNSANYAGRKKSTRTPSGASSAITKGNPMNSKRGR